MMTDRETLTELVQDPHGAFPALRRGFQRQQQAILDNLIRETPDPATAYAKLCAAHTLWLEYERLTQRERFVEHLAEKTSGG